MHAGRAAACRWSHAHALSLDGRADCERMKTSSLRARSPGAPGMVARRGPGPELLLFGGEPARLSPRPPHAAYLLVPSPRASALGPRPDGETSQTLSVLALVRAARRQPSGLKASSET